MIEKCRLIDSHPFLTTSSDIKEICKPLFEGFGISYFRYTKIFRKGGCIWLCTNNEWLSHYVDMGYYHDGMSEQNIDQYSSGVFVWQPANNAVLKDAQQNFNIDHGVTIIDQSKDYCEMYHFATRQENHAITNFYINHQDILRHFILYFKDKAHKLITSLNKSKIILPISRKIKTLDSHEFAKSPSLQNKHKFFESTTCQQFHLGGAYNNVYLTKREAECIAWLCKGKTADEIGIILNISRRTVINHLHHIKEKTACHSMSQLLALGQEFCIQAF